MAKIPMVDSPESFESLTNGIKVSINANEGKITII